MEIQQMRYVVEVAKQKSFTKAAEVLFTTQPALSQQIRKLEQELKTKLFIRTTRTVTLTSAGEEFVREAEKIIFAWESLLQGMQKYEKKADNSLRLGVMLGEEVKVLEVFSRKYPQYYIEVVEAEQKKLWELLINKELDVVIIRDWFWGNLDGEKVEQYKLVEDELILVVPETHPCADHETITVEEISKKCDVDLTPGPICRIVERAYAKAGRKFKPKTGQIKTMTQLMILTSEGQCCAFLPSKELDKFKLDNIRGIKIVPPISTNMVLSISKDKKGFAPIMALNRFLLEQIVGVY